MCLKHLTIDILPIIIKERFTAQTRRKSTKLVRALKNMSEVITLHGLWDSPFSCRVVWALKLKGIPYNYVEEDMKIKKSELLLLYNPVHKKVPVLVHDGKPICESMIIVQYLDDTWPGKSLLPIDPYERALARFWVKYADEKGPVVWEVFMKVGEEQEKAKEECLKMLRTVEEEALGDKKFFGGDEIGIVDIAFGWMAHWLGVLEEVLEVKLLQPHQFPRLHAWTYNFKQVPLIQQNLPNRDNMLAHFKALRPK